MIFVCIGKEGVWNLMAYPEIWPWRALAERDALLEGFFYFFCGVISQHQSVLKCREKRHILSYRFTHLSILN